jgi:predicted metal-dependent peptidase
MVAHNPLHGPGQAGFPHPALALGEDVDASQGIAMTDGRHRQPVMRRPPGPLWVATPISYDFCIHYTSPV